jgi:predicted RND superfamily exporter protein
MRIRCQMKDIGSYEQAEKVDHLKVEIDEILNPDKKELTRLFTEVEKGKESYIDSILDTYTSVQNNLTSILSKNNQEQQLRFDSNPSLLRTYYKNPEFKSQLKDAIEMDYFDVTITGTSVIASEGTRYLVNNLFSSLLFAILIISLLMAILFRSWRMVVISMVPNFIPLLVTGGLMGYFQIPLKPSTLLVFSIALGISVDDTIHFLAKYRQEIKSKKWNLKDAVLISIKETGLGMFYTSIVLFCGFSVFNFSQFGGTQALGLLISITLLIAMITNLLILPSLLLSLDKLIVSKSFKEPYFDSYTEESEIDWSELQLSTTEDLEEGDTTKDSKDQSNV